ncbi:unnamed protein product [Rhizoctonia solani]|uniref:F-box domain-containing protein n=1 Tax=Rhizoctonia solani TaxID=456999 RepID=A0A8H3ECX9_9AGAM|nr:unnamed protein product [Rhizoctonia solani]
MIKQTEEARELLATAVSRFCDLSTLLETQYSDRGENSNELVACSDSSLDYLQSILTEQLTRARVSLSKTRNRHSQSILCLPQEIASEIFHKFVYGPTDDDLLSGFTVTPMERRIEIIYRRLYLLLAVCASWRRIALDFKTLWSVIPVGFPVIGRMHCPPADLCIQRAGTGGLYLAMLEGGAPGDQLPLLAQHIARFSDINVHGDSDDQTLPRTLRALLEQGGLSTISNLSLRHQDVSYTGHIFTQQDARIRPNTTSLNNTLGDLEPRFSQMLKSLTTLRLSGASLDWPHTSFSSRLVILHVGEIRLGRQPDIDSFLSALTSATELRTLKLTNIWALPDHYTINKKAILPKLESLSLGDLNYTMQDILITAITPNSYHLTVKLDHKCFEKQLLLADGVTIFRTVASNDELSSLMSKVPINNLILPMHMNGHAWTLGSVIILGMVLKAVPAVTTLVLNGHHIDQELLRSLVPSLGSPPHVPTFPRLEKIEFRCAVIRSSLAELKAGFEALLNHHPIRQMIFSKNPETGERQKGYTLLGFDVDSLNYGEAERARVSAEFGQRERDNENPVENDEVIGWLETNVPGFGFIPEQAYVADALSTWHLWDV